jgi:hypothetical protein
MSVQTSVGGGSRFRSPNQEASPGPGKGAGAGSRRNQPSPGLGPIENMVEWEIPPEVGARKVGNGDSGGLSFQLPAVFRNGGRGSAAARKYAYNGDGLP